MMPLLPSMATCHDLAVPAEVMQHVVNVESGNNPFAIGVVGAHLERQPKNLDEAVATARMLESQGYNFSLGIAQVNRANLAKYGLDSYEKAFDMCPNLTAGTQILAQCYAQAGGDWGKSFSCYYSGNFAKGYEDGYVQKVYESIHRSALPASVQTRAIPIQLSQTTRPQPTTSEQYLVRMRSSAIDNATAAVVANAVQAVMPSAQAPAQTAAPSGQNGPQPAPPIGTAAAPALAANQATTPASSGNDIFEPQVRGTNDPVSLPKEDAPPVQVAGDHADLRQGGHDDAFVF